MDVLSKGNPLAARIRALVARRIADPASTTDEELRQLRELYQLDTYLKKGWETRRTAHLKAAFVLGGGSIIGTQVADTAAGRAYSDGIRARDRRVARLVTTGVLQPSNVSTLLWAQRVDRVSRRPGIRRRVPRQVRPKSRRVRAAASRDGPSRLEPDAARPAPVESRSDRLLADLELHAPPREPTPGLCAYCEGPLPEGRRADATTCSDSHRVMLHRQRQKVEQACPSCGGYYGPRRVDERGVRYVGHADPVTGFCRSCARELEEHSAAA